MPLTPEELAFLGPFMIENTEIKAGPYTRALRSAGLSVSDIPWLTEAYKISDPPRIEVVETVDGSLEELKIGRKSELPPPFPWANAEAARVRNAQLEPDVRAFLLAYYKERAG